MKTLQLVWFVLLVNCISCVGQAKKPALSGAMVTSAFFRTSDSLHYTIKHDRTPANGRFIIYEEKALARPPDPTNDTSSPPLSTVLDRHSRGAFSQGLKTGVWEYYTGEQKVREEVYKQGRRISKRKCPCKSQPVGR